MKNKVLFLMMLCLTASLFTTSSIAQADGFSFVDIEGKPQKLENYQGKWVLVNIWATWCPPCRQELPELVSLHKARKDKDLVVVSIAMDSGDAAAVAPFAKSVGINFPVIIWEWQKDAKVDQEVMRNFGDIQAVPISFLYTPKGELYTQIRGGGLTRENIEAYLYW